MGHLLFFVLFCFHDRLVIEEMKNLRLDECGIQDLQSQLFEGTKCHKHKLSCSTTFKISWVLCKNIPCLRLVTLTTFKHSWLFALLLFSKRGLPSFLSLAPTTTPPDEPVFVKQLAEYHGTGNLRRNFSPPHPSISFR